MVLIIKRLVSVFKPGDKVPKKWQNLKKAVYVATFKQPYKNIPDILRTEYGLRLDEKIVVFWMKAIPRPGWSYWRLPFKKVFSGRLEDFGAHLLNWRSHLT